MEKNPIFNSQEDQVTVLNKLAMEYLQRNELKKSLSSLKQALLCIQSTSNPNKKAKLLAITFNNLGCLFKRSQNYPEALKYLFKVVQLEDSLQGESATVASSHLNICSVLSHQKDHNRALHHGLRAINLLSSLQNDPRHVATLVVAFHNVASEYKTLGEAIEAEYYLKKAVQISSDSLGAKHHLTLAMAAALSDLTKKSRFGYLANWPNFPVSTKSRAKSNENKSTSGPKRNLSRFTEQRLQKASPATLKRAGKTNKHLTLPLVSDLEISAKSEKSLRSSKPVARKFDLKLHKETEIFAAVLIQKNWRGYFARKKWNEEKLKIRLKKAEKKAKKAIEEYERLKKLTKTQEELN